VPFPGDGELGPAGDLPAAVVAALGAGEVIVDVTERLEVAGAAVGAALDRAVGGEHAGDGSREILTQELLADAGVEVIPREHLIERTATEVEPRVEAVLGHRRSPEIRLAVLGPAVEAGAAAVSRLDHVGDPPVAAREYPLEEREPGIVPPELDPAPAELASENRLADAGLLEVELAGPLERRVRLRREGRHARGHGEAPARRGPDARGQL